MVALAKGTLSLYFRKREEIFLTLLTRELRAWLSSLSAAVDKFPEPEDILDWIADSVGSRNELLRLGALLHSVLERNLSVDSAREFKLTFDAGGRRNRGGVDSCFATCEPLSALAKDFDAWEKTMLEADFPA